MFKDFDLMANTDSLHMQHSTLDLAGRESLMSSGFNLSPTGRTIDPELKGADIIMDAEHVRAARNRRAANRKKEAHEEWQEWKQDKGKEIVEKKEREKRQKENKERMKKVKKEMGKTAYEHWQLKKKLDKEKKKREAKEKRKKLEEEQRVVEELTMKKKKEKLKERLRQGRILEKQMAAAMAGKFLIIFYIFFSFHLLATSMNQS